MLQNELFVGQLFLANCWIKRFKTICFIPHKRNYHNYFKTIKIKGRAIFCLQFSILSAFSSVSLWTLKAPIEAIVNGISFGLIFLTLPTNSVLAIITSFLVPLSRKEHANGWREIPVQKWTEWAISRGIYMFEVSFCQKFYPARGKIHTYLHIQTGDDVIPHLQRIFVQTV